jgi:hypothetical protein
MDIRDNIPDPQFFSAEESPIPVPPVEESWSLMRKKLEDATPKPGAWRWSLRVGIFAAVVAVSMLAWFAVRILSVQEHILIHRHDTIHHRDTNYSGLNSDTTHLLASRPGASRVNQPGASPVSPMAVSPSNPGGVGSAGGPPSNPAGASPAAVPPPNHTAVVPVNRAGIAPASHAGSPLGNQSGSTEAGNQRSAAEAINPPGQAGLITYDLLASISPSASIPIFPYPFPDNPDTAFSMHHPVNQVNIKADSSGSTGKAGKPRKASSSGKSAKALASQKPPLMAAGLSLIQNAPLGNQLIYIYNINGKSNPLSDYIPAVYLRYFLRKNLYLQASFHFNSPQYTPSVVIDSPRTEPKNNLTVFTTSTLQKLYYTDIPVTIDYSPLAHLFLGMGLQYSGLHGGLVYQRVVSYDSTSILPITYRMGTLSKTLEQSLQLRKTDWRILFEASYYWKRVTLGLRYQQPLSPFSKAGSTNASGLEKNTSLGFYLQYNLWERKRKN